MSHFGETRGWHLGDVITFSPSQGAKPNEPRKSLGIVKLCHAGTKLVEPSDTHHQILHNTLGVVPHSGNSPKPRLFGGGILEESHHIPFPQFDFWMEAAFGDFYDPPFSHVYFLSSLAGFCLHNNCQIFVFTLFVSTRKSHTPPPCQAKVMWTKRIAACDRVW